MSPLKMTQDERKKDIFYNLLPDFHDYTQTPTWVLVEALASLMPIVDFSLDKVVPAEEGYVVEDELSPPEEDWQHFTLLRDGEDDGEDDILAASATGTEPRVLARTCLSAGETRVKRS